MEEQTRTIFWNAPEWFSHHFVSILDFVYFGVPFLLFGLWAATIGLGLWRWFRLLRVGQGSVWDRLDRLPERIGSVLFDAIGQRIVVREPSGIAHLALYVGFVGLFFGTTIITVEADTKLEFYFGSFYVFYKFMMDVFGIVLVNACAYFLVRRLVEKPSLLENPAPEKMLGTSENLAGYTVPLTFLMAIGLTGFMLEGARIAAQPESSAGGAFVGAALGHVFGAFDLGTGFHKWIWWIHLVIVLSFLYTMTFTKLRHMFIAPVNLFFRNLGPRGRLAPITDFENAEKFGVNQIEDYDWKLLLDMGACLECGRCTINCPTVNTGKPLNPKKLVMAQREHLLAKYPTGFAFLDGGAGNAEHQATREALAEADMIKDVATEDAIWGCTTCGWCEEGCPVGIEHIQRIVDMRRYDVMTEGTFPASAQASMRGMETQSNPWGLAADKRAEWAADLDVPLLADNPTAEVLYWVGCAGSFDMRNQKVSRALVGILKKAGVDFAILGPEEGCTGDPARRLGNEYLYVTLAQQNVETLNRYNPKKIITQCPHCFHTIKNEYPRPRRQLRGRAHGGIPGRAARRGEDRARVALREEGRLPRPLLHGPAQREVRGGERDPERDPRRRPGRGRSIEAAHVLLRRRRRLHVEGRGARLTHQPGEDRPARGRRPRDDRRRLPVLHDHARRRREGAESRRARPRARPLRDGRPVARAEACGGEGVGSGRARRPSLRAWASLGSPDAWAH